MNLASASWFLFMFVGSSMGQSTLSGDDIFINNKTVTVPVTEVDPSVPPPDPHPHTLTPETTTTTSSHITTPTPKSTTVTTPTTLKPTNASTTKPTSTTTSVPSPTTVPAHERKFDGPSFVGGIILALGMVAIGFVAFKFYKARTEMNYHTL